MNGILIIDKPKNFTSFDVIAVLRKTLKIKKIGHTGTLDPMATGVLPILLGSATKIQALIPDNDKEYIAKFQLGKTTDTLDITGKIILETESHVKKEELLGILKNFKGNIKQIPPMYSAVQKNGVRLYDLARKGIEIERETRPVTIYKLELLGFDENSQEGELFVSCSKGTYIRSLCDDIGKMLGCGAVLTELRRTKACNFDLSSSISLEKAKELASENKISEKIIPIDKIFDHYEKIKISEAQATRFKNGGSLDLDRLKFKYIPKDEAIICVYDHEDIFLGLGKVNLDKNELAIFRLLCSN